MEKEELDVYKRQIQVRVEAWQDPIASYNGSGYQVAQSLFAIGTGGWFGTGPVSYTHLTDWSFIRMKN